mgnify:CR=1 FL=1
MAMGLEEMLGFLQNMQGSSANDPRSQGFKDAMAAIHMVELLKKFQQLSKEQGQGQPPMGQGQLPPMGRMPQGPPQGGMPPGAGPMMGG